MPYITNEERDEVDAHGAKTVGQLTYKLTGELAVYLDDVIATTGEIHYSDLAECLAALEGAKADFIERVLKPYEKKKRKENGDVWGGRVIQYVGDKFAGYKYD